MMPKITQLSQLDLNQTYSYADYLTWHTNEAIELIKGKITLMSPAPNVKHQGISGNLTALLHTFFNYSAKIIKKVLDRVFALKSKNHQLFQYSCKTCLKLALKTPYAEYLSKSYASCA